MIYREFLLQNKVMLFDYCGSLCMITFVIKLNSFLKKGSVEGARPTIGRLILLRRVNQLLGIINGVLLAFK